MKITNPSIYYLIALLLLATNPHSSTGQIKSRKYDGPEGFGLLNNSRIKIGGHLEAYYRNNQYGVHSYYEDGSMKEGNGDVFGAVHRSTYVNLEQAWLYVDRAINTKDGFDWGFRVDAAFGLGVGGIQKSHDRSFDYKIKTSAGYGVAFSDIKLILGYKNLSAQLGLFTTPIGYRRLKTWENSFITGALINGLLPSTHAGVLASYKVSDRLSLTAGMADGYNNGANRFGDISLIAGMTLKTTKKTNLIYTFTLDKMNNGSYDDGSLRYGNIEASADVQGYIHSVYHTWSMADGLSWVCEWIMAQRRIQDVSGDKFMNAYGVNNQVTYAFCKELSMGVRMDWLRDNDKIVLAPADYNQTSFVINWQPVKYIKIRPELRYDWARGGVKPFNKNHSDRQFSYSLAAFFRF